MDTLLAVLLTFGLLALMGLAIIVLGRGWPRSSRLGGYRARSHDAEPGSSAGDQERGAAIREDDDARWRWDGGAGDGPSDAGDRPSGADLEPGGAGDGPGGSEAP